MENSVSLWQESISSLPEKQFFSTMRLYLGEIKTPFNKQRLIEGLASFLKNPKTNQNLLSLLDLIDLQFLTAILIIPNASQKLLIDFFSGTYSMSEVYSTLINLSERLLIYKAKPDFTTSFSDTQEIFFINPLLEPQLKPYLKKSILFPNHTISFYNCDDIFKLSPDFLAALFSYLNLKGIGCKADGIIKKNDLSRLSEIFNGHEKLIQLIIDSLINLSILRESDKNYKIDSANLNSFAKLNPEKQYALLCAASVSRFGREGLRKEAQLLLDCLASIPQSGLNRSEILRLAFLLGTRTKEGTALAKKSRFSQILEAAKEREKENNGDAAVQNSNLIDRMIASAIEMGLLQKLGKDNNENEIFTSGISCQNSLSGTAYKADTNPKVLNIDSIFSVTLMPGLSLHQLLQINSFMSIKKCGVVCEYEITRQSVSSAFDRGLSPSSLFEMIESYLPYEIPQNLKINITEWYNNYSSAKLYRGFILKVGESNISLVENNPLIKDKIIEKLAEGIYLLNLPLDASDTDINHFISTSGLDFLGQIKQPERGESSFAFPALSEGRLLSISDEKNVFSDLQIPNVVKGQKLMEEMRGLLESKDFDKFQKESLEHRIKNRLIISDTQLTSAAVRTEILEADGIDFSGKVHLLETAVKESDLTELQLPNADGSQGSFQLLGIPLSISKQPGEAVLRFQLQPTNEIETLLVSRISHVRRLRF